MAGPRLPAGGVIPTGFRQEGNFICGLNLEFDFVGRMPVGSKSVNVTKGTGEMIHQSCIGPYVSKWHGETPSGPFDWTCETQSGQVPPTGPAGGIGDRIRASAICQTVGYPGSFRLTVDVVQLDQGTESEYGTHEWERWAIAGAYLVLPDRPI